MSANDTEYETKNAFIEAVKDGGASLGGVEYFTECEGSATTYHARGADGDEDQVTKSEIESLWDELTNSGGDEAEVEEDEGPEEVHLGTYYFSQSNWDEDSDRETLGEILKDAGWYIDGEVDSGGYRIKTEP